VRAQRAFVKDRAVSASETAQARERPASRRTKGGGGGGGGDGDSAKGGGGGKQKKRVGRDRNKA
jgi:hypothetical protein